MAKTHRKTLERGWKEAQWRGQTRGSKRISLAEEGADDKEQELQGWPTEDDEKENTVAKKGKKKKKKRTVGKEMVENQEKVGAMKEKEDKEGARGCKGVTTEKEVYDASVWDWGDDKW